MIRPFALLLLLFILSPFPAGAAKAPACGAAAGDLAAIATVVASAETACPCDQFSKKREYITCFRSVTDAAISDGTLRKQCKAKTMRAASKSTCGAKPGAVTCCKTNAQGKDTCAIATSADKCTAPRGGTVEEGTSESCFDACLPTCEELNPSDEAVAAATAAVVQGREAIAWNELGSTALLVYAELGCKPTSPLAALRSEQAGVSNVNYCGKGDSETNPPDPLPKQLPSSCMNPACQVHDLCYTEQCIDSEMCMWTAQSDICDQPFFDRCDQPCTDSILDRINKTIICTAARLLKNVPDINPGCLGPPCTNGQTCNASTGMCEMPTPTPSPGPSPTPTPAVRQFCCVVGFWSRGPTGSCGSPIASCEVYTIPPTGTLCRGLIESLECAQDLQQNGADINNSCEYMRGYCGDLPPP